jgi:hypothetical protein
MIAPFYDKYRMAWPFGTYFDSSDINTSEDFPVWHVAGDWKTPPSKVCDLLTAKEFTFSFGFSAAAFNEEFTEDFPQDVSYSANCESGTWKYYDTRTEIETFNLNYKWDTQVKLFQRETDPDEDSPYFAPYGISGLRYFSIFEFTEFTGHWSIDITMIAPIPAPAKDQDGKYVWGINYFPSILSFVQIIRHDFSDPAYPVLRPYYLFDVGSSYLGVNDRGGQGQGSGGCFPVASVSIATHFPD